MYELFGTEEKANSEFFMWRFKVEGRWTYTDETSGINRVYIEHGMVDNPIFTVYSSSSYTIAKNYYYTPDIYQSFSTSFNFYSPWIEFS